MLVACACCMALLGGCVVIPMGPSSTSSGTSPGSTSASASKPSKAPRVSGGYPSGTTQKEGQLAVTATSEPLRQTAPGGQKAGSGKAFLVVDLDFQNQTTLGIPLQPDDFKFADPKGTLLTPVPSPPAFNATSEQQLNPGYGSSTAFVYEVPKDASGYVFAYTPEVEGKRQTLRWSMP